MTPNHYATLGLSPSSEDVVIRAAYLALMRRYHPDRNPSAEAAARARSVAAAYAVLGDPGKRAAYDDLRLSGDGPMELPPRPAPSMIPGGAFTAASLALLLSVAMLISWTPARLVGPQATRAHVPAPATAAGVAAEPAAVDGFDEPPAAGEDSPAASPPDPETAPAEPGLRADAQAPASPIRLARADPPPRPTALAPATPNARPASLPAAARPNVPQPALDRTAASAAPGPSFRCHMARTRGEVAACRNVQLANLDRQQALLYSQSWGRADAAKRAELLRTRDRFVAQRDSCRSDACTTSAYLERMREVSEIMTGSPTRAR